MICNCLSASKAAVLKDSGDSGLGNKLQILTDSAEEKSNKHLETMTIRIHQFRINLSHIFEVIT